MSLGSSITLLAALFGKPVEAADSAPHAAAAGAITAREEAKLSPIELTAFGDIGYARRRPGSDDFYIGSLEVDISLSLVPYVSAYGAIAYDPARDAMGLAAFTVDSGLWGKDEHAFFHSDLVESSGIVFGKFDVPFGIAYLKYGSPDNRMVTQPALVEATHAAWNDLGAQVYASTKLVNVLGYVVNGSRLLPAEAAGTDAALGGRLGIKPFGRSDCGCKVELGGSAARNFGSNELTLLGLDLQTSVAGLEAQAELIRLSRVTLPGPRSWGFYSQGVYSIDPVFFGARYAVTLENDAIRERTVTGAVGIEIFPQGELRVAYERGLEAQADTLLVQIVGGSNWKPTGLRR